MDKDKQKIEKFKMFHDFVRIVARVFYSEEDFVVMDTISHLYFKNFV